MLEVEMHDGVTDLFCLHGLMKCWKVLAWQDIALLGNGVLLDIISPEQRLHTQYTYTNGR